MMIILLILTALFSAPGSAQSNGLECPLPTPETTQQVPPRHYFDADGQFHITGVETFTLPDGLSVNQAVWSDDGEVAVLLVSDGALDYRVFKFADGQATEMLNQDTLLSLREETFRDAVQLYNPAFVPGTHTVLANTEILSNAEGIYFEIPSDLWALDTDTGEFHNVLPYGEGGKFSISPDGQTVLVMDLEHIEAITIDGENARQVYEGRVGVGIGHEIIYPQIVWDADDAAVFRTLLFDAGTDDAPFAAPYNIYEFTLGDEITSTVLFSGQSPYIPLVKLSPDGYHSLEWRWLEGSSQAAIAVDNAETPLITFDIPDGMTPIATWDSPTHILYGYKNFENGEVFQWRVDLCGEQSDIEGA